MPREIPYVHIKQTQVFHSPEIRPEDNNAEASTSKGYEAAVRDSDAPPPPHLPLHTIQAIATGACQMHLEDVSEDSLNYDSTNDSVE